MVRAERGAGGCLAGMPVVDFWKSGLDIKVSGCNYAWRKSNYTNSQECSKYSQSVCKAILGCFKSGSRCANHQASQQWSKSRVPFTSK
ncbi:ankyrin repeat protein [Echinococcus multilocularis]|uniref:Ankyrin repeat protein n=1 Tax=Echinococcus multilocularis TaxID=6211 RepID=A0A0S4MLS3_ECHMU|nr:ankyrin repeat protein [Echinococcus multilocularis]